MKLPTQATKTANDVDQNCARFIEKIHQRIETPRSDFVPLDESDTMFDDIKAQLREREAGKGAQQT